MHFDDLLFTYLGEFGKYQKIQFILVCLPCILVSTQVVSWTFTGADIGHRCLFPDEGADESFDYPARVLNISLKSVQCSRPVSVDNSSEVMESCEEFKYDHSEITNSAISRWNVVCNRKIGRSVVQSMYYVGQFFGSILFGYLADRHGRKNVFIFAIALLGCSGTAMAFVPALEAFAFLRMIAGVCHPGIFVISVVLGMELVGPSMRMMAGVFTGLFFSIGQLLLGGLAYAIRDYQYLQLAISAPALLFLCYYWIIPESARWLVSQRRFEDADKILRRAATMNKRELPESWWKLLDQDHEKSKLDENAEVRKYTYLDLFRTPQIRKRLLISWVCWPTVSMIYYGIAMNPSFAGGDRYVTFILSGLVEVPGIIIGSLFINRIGRKALQIIGFLVPGTLMIVTIFIPKDMTKLTVACVIISKSLITMTYAVIYIFTPELFPTVVRNLAMGTCSMIARLGAFGASYLVMYLADISRVAVVLIFGCFALTSAILTLLQPETTGHKMMESIEDAEKFGRGQKWFSFSTRCSSESTAATDREKKMKNSPEAKSLTANESETTA